MKTERDYALLILEDILRWYESVEAPAKLPGFSGLKETMREARVLVDANRQRSALETNAEIRREWDEAAGAGVK